MIIIPNTNRCDDCSCTNAPGLPIRPGLDCDSAEPTTFFNPDGSFDIEFGNYPIQSDAPDTKLAIHDLDGRFLTSDFIAHVRTVFFRDRAWRLRLHVAPGILVVGGTFQVMVWDAISEKPIYSGWLVSQR